MNRLWRSGWLLPLGLAVAGVALIIAGQLQGDGIAFGDPTPSASRSPSVAPAPTASPTPSAEPTGSPPRSPGAASPTPSESPTPTPSPTYPPDVVAERLQIPTTVPPIDVAVFQATDEATCNFPPDDGAYVICRGDQPGRDTNAYIFAHALNHLFKPLWNVQLGAEVIVTMSDGSVLRYLVTEVRPNVPCPDANPPDPGLNPPPGELPLVLQYAENCSEGVRWTIPTPNERLTLQTSQGYNRNWGEFVVIAEPPPD